MVWRHCNSNRLLNRNFSTPFRTLRPTQTIAAQALAIDPTRFRANRRAGLPQKFQFNAATNKTAHLRLSRPMRRRPDGDDRTFKHVGWRRSGSLDDTRITAPPGRLAWGGGFPSAKRQIDFRIRPCGGVGRLLRPVIERSEGKRSIDRWLDGAPKRRRLARSRRPLWFGDWDKPNPPHLVESHFALRVRFRLTLTRPSRPKPQAQRPQAPAPHTASACSRAQRPRGQGARRTRHLARARQRPCAHQTESG